MALTDKDFEEIRKELDSAENPLILLDNDPDGLTSYLLFFHYMQKGKAVLVKSNPKVDEKYLRYIEENNPDKIFILDIATVTQEFVDGANTPIVWIDHHNNPDKIHGVKYFNPMNTEPRNNLPTSYLCYKATEKNLWLAMIGIVGDWHLPDISKEYTKKFPDLLPKDVKKPEQALFDTKLGKLVRIMAFNLKGSTIDQFESINIFKKIKTPYEILNQETSYGKKLYKKYEKFNKKYQKIFSNAKELATDDKFLIYIYDGDDSMSSEVSNEILYNFPDKIVLIGREKDGEVRLSLRGSGKNKILPALNTALEGLKGYGGGHEYACGAGIKKDDFEVFLTRFKQYYENL